MKAFDSMAEELKTQRWVMLMRRDLSSDFTKFDVLWQAYSTRIGS
jgi:hypothetical protein